MLHAIYSLCIKFADEKKKVINICEGILKSVAICGIFNYQYNYEGNQRVKTEMSAVTPGGFRGLPAVKTVLFAGLDLIFAPLSAWIAALAIYIPEGRSFTECVYAVPVLLLAIVSVLTPALYFACGIQFLASRRPVGRRAAGACSCSFVNAVFRVVFRFCRCRA